MPLRSEVASDVGYGAIGGAASAAFSPDLLKAIDPTGAALSPGQQAAMAGFATLLGGGLAGLAGANAQGGATAAQNEVLNNTDDHPENAAKNGGALNAFGNWLQNTYGDPVGSFKNWGNQLWSQFLGTSSPQTPQSPDDLDGGSNNTPHTGAAPVTPAVPVCDPPVCTVMPGSPGTPGYAPSNVTLSSGNGDTGNDAAGQASNSNSLPANSSQLSHIFRDDEGHLTDTPQNRQTLLNLVNNPENSLGTDQFGNKWFAQTLSNGAQLWGSVRNGVLQNGGLNTTPRSFNPATGLSKGK